MSKKETHQQISNPESIPVEGALGLLALGSVGLRAWRKVRDAAIESAGEAGVSSGGGETRQEGKGGDR